MLKDLYNDIPEEDINPEDIQTAEEITNENYQFADGTLPPDEQLDQFLQEFRIEKEEKDCPTEPSPEDELEDEEENEEEISNITARNTAIFIVNTIDDGASAGLAFLSKDNQDGYRAGKNQKKNLQDLFTRFCKEKGAEIPIGWQIFFCLATVYGAQVPRALDHRRLHNALQAIEEEKKQLLERRQRLEENEAELETERKRLRRIKEENIIDIHG